MYQSMDGRYMEEGVKREEEAEEEEEEEEEIVACCNAHVGPCELGLDVGPWF